MRRPVSIVMLLTALSAAPITAESALAQGMNTGPYATPIDGTPLGGGFRTKKPKPNDDAQKATNYQTANAKLMEGKYDEAAPLLKAVVADDPRNDDAWNDLGIANQKMNRNADAVGDYERALSIKPTRKDTRAHLGEVQLALGNLSKAEEQLAQLKQICVNGCEELQSLEGQISAYKSAHPA